jgi:hypothetical protein
LVQWLQQRMEEVYPQQPGYQAQTIRLSRWKCLHPNAYQVL